MNLTARHHNDSVLLMTWDPPHDWGGRQEVMYHVNCEKEAEARWRACGDDVVVLPDSVRLNGTSVSITGLNPQHNYRLLVKAWNNISTLQGGPPSSTATVTIHRCMQGWLDFNTSDRRSGTNTSLKQEKDSWGNKGSILVSVANFKIPTVNELRCHFWKKIKHILQLKKFKSWIHKW